MKSASPKLICGLLAALAFTLATTAHLRAISRPGLVEDEGALKKMLGDGRRLFSGQFVTMADVYLHSGYYPSIFDRRDNSAPKAVSGKIAVATASEDTDHDHEAHDHAEHQHDADGNCVVDADHDEHHDEHEKAMDFLGRPRDWLEAFIRRFRITEHTHLESGGAREVLPWLKMAIELNPQAIDTYTSTAYWLRNKLGKTKEAEEVLREGLRNNPNSFELLFEMGKLYREAYHDDERARNIWLLAYRRWNEQNDEAKSDSLLVLGEILVNLGTLERGAGNLPRALGYFELAKSASPNPTALQKQIDEMRAQKQIPTGDKQPQPTPPE